MGRPKPKTVRYPKNLAPSPTERRTKLALASPTPPPPKTPPPRPHPPHPLPAPPKKSSWHFVCPPPPPPHPSLCLRVALPTAQNLFWPLMGWAFTPPHPTPPPEYWRLFPSLHLSPSPHRTNPISPPNPSQPDPPPLSLNIFKSEAANRYRS